MTLVNYSTMELNELRRYVLSHREDTEAFQAYIDRSKAEGRMFSFDSNDSQWEERLDNKLFHHPQEKDYPNAEIEVEDSSGEKRCLQTYLLRVYPETFNGYDAYMDLPMEPNPDIQKVHSFVLSKTWEVVAGPTESPVRGDFRGDNMINNPPAWVVGLRLVSG